MNFISEGECKRCKAPVWRNSRGVLHFLRDRHRKYCNTCQERVRPTKASK